MSSRPNRTLFRALVAVMSLGIGLLTVVAGPGTAQAVGDKDCGDFATQRAAQVFYLQHGGPQSDPHRLDADGDGEACESNPCPCYFGSTPPGGGGGDATPPQPRRTTVSLAASRRSGIAGERLSLTVRVTPARSRAVVLERRTGSRWTVVKRARTSSSGRYTLTTRVASSTRRYRAVAPRLTGSTPFLAGISATRRVRTESQHLSLAVPSRAEQDTQVTVRATASPARAGRGVELLARRGAGWVRAGLARQDSRGRVAFRIAATDLGRHRYQAQVLAAGGAARVGSDTADLTVRDTVAPAAPTGLEAVGGDRSITLSWQPVRAGDLTGYRLYSVSSAGATRLRDLAPTQTSLTLTGLAPGTRLSYAVAAYDEVANLSARSASAQATVLDLVPPAMPANLAVVPGPDHLDLSWTAVTDADLATYRVQWRPSGTSTWTVVETTGTSHSLTGLAPGTSYDLQVSAVDRSGNPSSTTSARVETLPAPDTTPPATPSGLAVAGGDLTLDASWLPVADSDLAGYVVQYATSADGPWTGTDLLTGTATQLAAEAGTTYQVRVAALDLVGNLSPWSEPVTASTTPVAAR